MKLEVRKAKERDLTDLKRLIDTYLAQDYYSMEELHGCIRGERNLFYVVTDADREGMIVSFFYAFLAPLDEALELLHVRERPQALKEYGGDTPVGVYKTGATAKEYQGKGLCSSFIRDLEPVMRDRGARMILVTAWRKPDLSVPAGGMVRNASFQEVCVIRRPWESLTLYCTGCGRIHCICDAVFYVKKLDEAEGEGER